MVPGNKKSAHDEILFERVASETEQRADRVTKDAENKAGSKMLKAKQKTKTLISEIKKCRM